MNADPLSEAASRLIHSAMVGLPSGDEPSAPFSLHALAAWPDFDMVEEELRGFCNRGLRSTITFLRDPAEQRPSENPQTDLRRLWSRIPLPREPRYRRQVRLFSRQEELRHVMVGAQQAAEIRRLALQKFTRVRSKKTMNRYLTLKEVTDLLKAARGGKTLADFAEEISEKSGIPCSFQYLSQVLKGLKGPGDAMLKYLKLEKVTVYQRL